MQVLPTFLVGEGPRELFLRYTNEIVEVERPYANFGIAVWAE